MFVDYTRLVFSINATRKSKLLMECVSNNKFSPQIGKKTSSGTNLIINLDKFRSQNFSIHLITNISYTLNVF